MPSNMVLPVYSGDKNKDGGLRRSLATRLLHARVFIERFKLPIAILVIIAVALLYFSSSQLPQTPNGDTTRQRPDLRVGIGQKNDDEQPIAAGKSEPIARPDAAGVVLPNLEPAEKQRQEDQRKEAELAEQKAAEERAAAERAAAEEEHRGDDGKGSEQEGEDTNNKGDEGEKIDTEIHLPETQEEENDPIARERQQAVREAFLHAWRSYEKYAWGNDELRPQSRVGMNWLSSGLGATIVDSLSTMHVMGLRDEFLKARNWVAEELPKRIANVRIFS